MSMDISSPQKRRMGDPIRLSTSHKSLDAELCGLGHIKRCLQPPGGNETGVFDAYKLPAEVSTPRRKVKDYFKSHIFDVGETPPPRPITPASESTHNRLFCMTPAETTVARHNHQKSTVFEPEPVMPKKYPDGLLMRNPITGELCASTNGNKIRKQIAVRNPITFEGIEECCIPSRGKQPPGGKCTFVLEYIE